MKEGTALETIQTIYNLYKKENIDRHLEKLINLKLLTTKGNLIPASQCYFSNVYQPILEIENMLDDDIFLSQDYLILDNDIDEIKRFFKKIGAQEQIEPLKLNDKINTSILSSSFELKNNYFIEADKKFKPFQSTFTANEYKNIIYIKFLEITNDISFSKLFWDSLISNNHIL